MTKIAALLILAALIALACILGAAKAAIRFFIAVIEDKNKNERK